MYEALAQKKSFAVKPHDDATLDEHSDWQRDQCVLIHKTLQVQSRLNTV